MVDSKKKVDEPKVLSTVDVRDSGQASPFAILALALAGGIGYFAWKLWAKRQSGNSPNNRATAGSQPEEAAGCSTSAGTSKSKSRGSPFSFDRQPSKAGAASTSGRSAVAAPGNTGGSSSNSHSRARNEPKAKPKTQKQLRKEAKQAKKAAREETARDAESSHVAAAISKRAKEVGLGQQQPEPERQHYVDYEGVTKAYDKIVEWQQTGKKKY